jgi:predicted transcriptional regulator
MAKMIHKCDKPKCPICGRRRREKMIAFLMKNFDTSFSYTDLMQEFSMPYETVRCIIKKLAIDGIVTKVFEPSKFGNKIILKGRQRIVRIHFNKYRHHDVNSKSWIKLF